ncbi:hypothetical protein CKAN_01291500 [Cinnamomum micranthum f. kanehirae]|uniref:Uncharacterized protein n=1 Tax=Cinnamomum micranthum f. kanehirae TaxID=337451 RepID=A0A443P038_9MAGN|nr:hypothetical protein CKAN_01291500 [Cinnamomum micranthum f. kanehirae]
MASKDNTKDNNLRGNKQGGYNLGGNNPKIQMTVVPEGKGNAQDGGGGHNPQVQGNIDAGVGGNVNLGFQGANFNSVNQGNTQDNNSGENNQRGNNSGGNNHPIQGRKSTQTGGGLYNPQVQGDINAGTGGNVNLGFQGTNFWKSGKCWW